MTMAINRPSNNFISGEGKRGTNTMTMEGAYIVIVLHVSKYTSFLYSVYYFRLCTLLARSENESASNRNTAACLLKLRTTIFGGTVVHHVNKKRTCSNTDHSLGRERARQF